MFQLPWSHKKGKDFTRANNFKQRIYKGIKNSRHIIKKHKTWDKVYARGDNSDTMISVYLVLIALVVLLLKHIRSFLAYRSLMNQLPGDHVKNFLLGDLGNYPGNEVLAFVVCLSYHMKYSINIYSLSYQIEMFVDILYFNWRVYLSVFICQAILAYSVYPKFSRLSHIIYHSVKK